ncbi:sulfatase [Chloroflexota bacterium]
MLVLVFDSFAANHISLYGYNRSTTPNIDKFASVSTVYHQHYAAGSFTPSGTASLLTGNYPWTNRAFSQYSEVVENFVNRNIFSAFDDYYRLAYSHNPMADILLRQMLQQIDVFKPQQELFLERKHLFNRAFSEDYKLASLSWDRIINKNKGGGEIGGYTNSLLLSNLYGLYKQFSAAEYQELFPAGLPAIQGNNYFLLETAVDWVNQQVRSAQHPFLGYFHFLPPHASYRPRGEFINSFSNDRFQPLEKVDHILAPEEKISYQNFSELSRQYDEYILYLDAEFGRLMSLLETTGVLENTWIVLTSDHGELFERGVWGHNTKLMHEGISRIPLLIRAPGQKNREDVYACTSAVDVLPTLMHINGKAVPDWCAGEVLPPFREDEIDDQRPVFTIDSKGSMPKVPLSYGSIMMRKGDYKLMYYFGYPELPPDIPYYELYNFAADPEEYLNLFIYDRPRAESMEAEIKTHLAEAERLLDNQVLP